MLSVVFPYKKVVLCFLLPGHSHNIADRVIAWCRRATRKANIYTPQLLVEEINKVKSVHGVFLDHNKPTRPFFEQWGTVLHKYFTAPPAGYTSNYLFEIDQGICTARKTVQTPDDEAITFNMVKCTSIETVRKSFITELFGPSIQTLWEASIHSVHLPRKPTQDLSDKKMKSLSAKYFSIPQQHLTYYPAVPDSIIDAPDLGAVASDAESTPKLQSKRKPCRPKKKKTTLKPNQPSILQFFSTAQKPSPTTGLTLTMGLEELQPSNTLRAKATAVAAFSKILKEEEVEEENSAFVHGGAFVTKPSPSLQTPTPHSPDVPLVELLNAPLSTTGLSTPALPPPRAGTTSTIYAHVNRVLDRVCPAVGVSAALASHSFRRGGAHHANGCEKMTARWILGSRSWNLSTPNKGSNYIFIRVEKIT
ncbi:hypothetical protein F442_01495 [Phytophthora nicotianae P10297]|uniref:Uncharacterized protein n=1 Tax=Phytophthora nicotianae P10297 TaxID=1317064 RepID=W3A236_PHYNI|nr:hypothetical protein F442_01495 [Phytophthora nicotianae P10297]